MERLTAKDLAGFQEYYGPDWTQALRAARRSGSGFPPEQVILDVARLVAEVRRLRSLVGRVAAHRPDGAEPGCPHLDHEGEDDCPWPEIEAEALAQREDEKR